VIGLELPLWTLGAAYLAGSFPTAYLVGKANGVDLRTVGSGNLGATNVYRTLGWQWGLLVYLSLVGAGIAAFVFYTHRDNIRRLMRGNERKLGGDKSVQEGGMT